MLPASSMRQKPSVCKRQNGYTGRGLDAEGEYLAINRDSCSSTSEKEASVQPDLMYRASRSATRSGLCRRGLLADPPVWRAVICSIRFNSSAMLVWSRR